MGDLFTRRQGALCSLGEHGRQSELYGIAHLPGDGTGRERVAFNEQKQTGLIRQANDRVSFVSINWNRL
jgi:hypothetical protein